MTALRRMFAAHAQAEQRGMPVDELLGAHEHLRSGDSRDGGGEEGTYTRRGFVLGGAGLLAGAALAVGGAAAFLSTLASARLLDRPLRHGQPLWPYSLYRCLLAALVVSRLRDRDTANAD